jgi:hypothetical protein
MSITDTGTRRDGTTVEDASLHQPPATGRVVEASATVAPDGLAGRLLPMDLGGLGHECEHLHLPHRSIGRPAWSHTGAERSRALHGPPSRLAGSFRRSGPLSAPMGRYNLHRCLPDASPCCPRLRRHRRSPRRERRRCPAERRPLDGSETARPRSAAAFPAACEEAPSSPQAPSTAGSATREQTGEAVRTKYIGRGRGGPNRPKTTEWDIRYQITTVRRNKPSIEHRVERSGWQVQVSNAPPERL